MRKNCEPRGDVIHSDTAYLHGSVGDCYYDVTAWFSFFASLDSVCLETTDRNWMQFSSWCFLRWGALWSITLKKIAVPLYIRKMHHFMNWFQSVLGHLAGNRTTAWQSNIKLHLVLRLLNIEPRPNESE